MTGQKTLNLTVDELIQELRERNLFNRTLDEALVNDLVYNLELLKYMANFIRVEEEDMTMYKHRLAYYNRKSHYLNGRRVNRYIYRALKSWKAKNTKN